MDAPDGDGCGDGKKEEDKEKERRHITERERLTVIDWGEYQRNKQQLGCGPG